MDDTSQQTATKARMKSQSPAPGGRPKHAIWQYFQQPDEELSATGKKKRRARCSFCAMELSANPARMKSHILRRCQGATDDVKSMCSLMEVEGDASSASSSPMTKKRLRELPIVDRASLPSMAAAASSSESLLDGPKVILCYGDSLTWGFDPEESVVNKRLPYGARWTTILQNELGLSARVISEGLNRRTTVFDNPLNGMYSVNGRKSLPVILHSHKPIDLVVLQLGVNDMRHIYNTRPCDIARGLEVLLQDIKVSTVGPGNVDPDILVLSPPFCRETAIAHDWGFLGCEKKSIDTIREFKAIIEQHPGVHFLDISRLCKTGSDGIHLSPQSNIDLGKHVAIKVQNIFDVSTNV